jgi:hypothetical protein
MNSFHFRVISGWTHLLFRCVWSWLERYWTLSLRNWDLCYKCTAIKLIILRFKFRKLLLIIIRWVPILFQINFKLLVYNRLLHLLFQQFSNYLLFTLSFLTCISFINLLIQYKPWWLWLECSILYFTLTCFSCWAIGIVRTWTRHYIEWQRLRKTFIQTPKGNICLLLWKATLYLSFSFFLCKVEFISSIRWCWIIWSRPNFNWSLRTNLPSLHFPLLSNHLFLIVYLYLSSLNYLKII